MKYLQLGVYPGGLSNQLMSLELGVGLAYLTNRVLVSDVGKIRIPSGQTLIGGTEAPHILDLFDIPNPVIMPGQRIPTDGSDLVCRDFDCNLVNTAFFFPSDLDTNSDDARAFADGRPLKTFDDSLQMAGVIRLHSCSTFGFYSYVFYVPESRERLFRVIRCIRPKKYYLAFAAAIKATIGSTFNAVHIRRTDFRKEDPAWVHPSPGAILENMLTVLPREELLLLCTDEPCRSWFRPILAEYKNHLFLDDFISTKKGFSQLPFSGNAVQALITMLVAAQSDRFMGTLLSTFTSIIQRWRGQNGKALSFEYIYNPLGEYLQFQRGQLVETRSGPYSWNRLEKPYRVHWLSWAREWPESLSEIHRLVTVEQEKLTRRSPAKTAPGTRPEIKLLLCCARTCVDIENAEHIRTLLREDIDWGYLISIGLRHGLMPLLYQNLNTTCPEAVPKIVLDQLRNHFHANVLHNFLLTKELLKLLNLFGAHDISAIPYKGPALTAAVYGNLLLRQFGDLDILVRERDYQRAQHLLIAQDYRLRKEFEWESTFVDGSGRVAVDLHKGMTPREFPSPLDFEYLSGGLQRIVLAGREVSSLSPEDTLLMLAIQITKDAGGRNFQLAKICDIAELLRVYPRLDLAQALKQARKLGGERMLLFSLRLTNDLLGTALPQEIMREPPFHPSIDELIDYARQQLFHRGDRTAPDQPTVDRFRWAIRERLRDKLCPYYLRYLHDVIIPCELDRRLLPLPGRLSFLYYFIRPIRLVGKYGLRLFSWVMRTSHRTHTHEECLKARPFL